MTSSIEQHRVRVLQGKGRKQRWTAISDIALEALGHYLDSYRGRDEGPLFQTVDGRRMPHHHMNVMFTRHGRKTSVAQVNPHRFRHIFPPGRFAPRPVSWTCSTYWGTPVR